MTVLGIGTDVARHRTRKRANAEIEYIQKSANVTDPQRLLLLEHIDIENDNTTQDHLRLVFRFLAGGFERPAVASVGSCDKYGFSSRF